MKILIEDCDLLPRGNFGSVVKGTFDGRQVAVKKLPLQFVIESQENALLGLDHPNIVKFFYCESDHNFRYYAMELCTISLDRLLLMEDDPQKHKRRRHIEVFVQLASGLKYLHSKKFIHNHIRPENILVVQRDDRNDEIKIKLALQQNGKKQNKMEKDFGLAGIIDLDATLVLERKTKRTQIWSSPEILRLQMQVERTNVLIDGDEQHLDAFHQDSKRSHEDQGDDNSDVFALALVFGCILLKGKHLYGSNENEDEIRDNIINKSPINMHQIDVKLREFYEDELLGKMLEDEPSQRISAAQVVRTLESIKEKLSRKEQELRKVCAEYTELDLAEKIKDLIRYGIDVNAKDEEGWNALHHLCRDQSRSNLIDAIRPLTESGIDVKAKGNDGSNALHYLARHVSSKDFLIIMEFLAEYGMDVFAKDNDGQSPFFYVNKDNNSTQRMEISFDRKAVLGEGGYGCVFKGTYYDKEVAVKRVRLTKVNKTEEEAMLKLDHQFIMKLIHCESDHRYRYYALELCVASLDKLFLKEDKKNKKYKGPMPRHIEAFLQLALGLEHIHSMKLIHRDIKPENILISETPTSESVSVTLKWADFGLSNIVNERGTFTMDKIRGTEKWFAPEILKLLRDNKKGRGTISSDVFALGLVFGCLFLDGKHLYGSNKIEISLNIIERNAVNMKDIDSVILEYYENNLLKKMLADIPDRMTSTEVVVELKSIKEKIIEKEGELRRLFAGGFSLDGKEKFKELIRLGIDFNAKDNSGRNALHYLCLNNTDSTLIGAIGFLIENGIDVNARDLTERNALHVLCLNSSNPKLTDAIDKLKESGIDVNAKDKMGWNALHWLCLNETNPKLTDAIDKLKQSGIDVNEKDEQRRNALHLLCCLNSSNPKLTDAIEKLKESGIDVNAKDKMGLNALHWLCFKNSNPALSEAIEMLKQSGIDVNAKNNDGWNALHWLCFKNSNPALSDAIEMLKQCGIDINAKSNVGWNALHFLCLNSSNPKITNAIEKLKESGIDDNAKDNEGRNALHVLCLNSSNPKLTDAIDKLKESGIDVNAKDKMGWNALHLLCLNKTNPKLTDAIDKLKQSGIDVNEKDEQRRNALHLLCCLNSSNPKLTDAIEKLKESGIDVNAKDKMGLNALHWLCFKNSNPALSEAIEMLKQSGIDVNAKNNDGWNALHWLCFKNSNPALSEAIEMLTQSGIDVNAKNNEGRNALQFLCLNCSNPKLTDAIDKLKESGIDVNAKDKMGWNALHLLCLNKTNPKLTDAIDKLKQSGIDVNEKDEQRRNALHLLCCLNSSNPKLTDAIEKLKESGIDVNAKDKMGWNALHWLCFNNSNPALSEAIEMLTQSGIDVNAKNNEGRNALHLLCQHSSNPKLSDAIEKFIQSGIDVKAKDNMGRNALQLLGPNPNLTDAIKKLAIKIMSETRASTDKRRNEEKHPEGQLKKRMTNLPE